ncbi:MAG: UDP-2,3-diacylglucosamine hydrolase, partial [Pseudomonadota bacterium]
MAPLLQTDPASGMACLRAPARWQSVLLMSDLHLQADDLATFAAWRAQVQACQADALLLLGDVFEIWVGDDALPQDPFLQAALQVLQDAATQR